MALDKPRKMKRGGVDLQKEDAFDKKKVKAFAKDKISKSRKPLSKLKPKLKGKIPVTAKN